jgi:hypothetical protein
MNDRWFTYPGIGGHANLWAVSVADGKVYKLTDYKPAWMSRLCADICLGVTARCRSFQRDSPPQNNQMVNRKSRRSPMPACRFLIPGPESPRPGGFAARSRCATIIGAFERVSCREQETGWVAPCGGRRDDRRPD